MAGAGAQHRAAPLQPGGGALHPHLRPPVLADAGVGRRGRRPDERPADPEPHRLPRDASSSRPRRRRSSSPTSSREMRKEKNPDGDAQVPDVDQRRRAAVQHGLRRRLRRRRLLVRPLPHDGLVVRRQDGRTGTARSARRCATASALARFPGAILGPTNQADFVCAGSEQGKRYGRNGQGTGRMPGFCQCRPRSTTRSTPARSASTPREASRPRQGRRHADRGAGRADRRVRAGPLSRDRHVDCSPPSPGTPASAASSSSPSASLVLMRLGLPAPRHQHRRPPRLPARPHRPLAAG